MRLSLAWLLVVLVAVAGCGGGGDGGAPAQGGPTAGITIAPTAIVLDPSGKHTFAASVTGMADTGVYWFIREGAAGGSISSHGEYTAPASRGVFHVVARSLSDNTKTAEAQVIVRAGSATVVIGDPSGSATVYIQGLSPTRDRRR